jgi:hypothetical protein
MALAWLPVGAQEDVPGIWELLSDGSDGPGPRWDHTLAADDEGSQLLVFGGRDPGGIPLGDTWLYDLEGGEWHAVEGDGPAPRFGQAVAVDQEARILYLQGGQSDAVFFNDTWAFDLADETWTLIHAGDGAAPANRYGHSAVLDGDGHLIVSHGFTFEGRYNDTWSLDLDELVWTDISPADDGLRPINRCLHEAVWDGERGRMLLFGGCASGFGPCPLGDLWAFDPEARSWADLTPAAGPTPRSNPALVLAAGADAAWLVGGLTEAGYAADVWRLVLDDDGATWEEIPSGDGPSPRASHDATISDGHVYLFGGTGDEGTFADLWTAKVS